MARMPFHARMRSLWLPLSLFVLSVACSAPASYVISDHESSIGLELLAADLAAADIVVLGEEHDAVLAHEAHLDILKALHRRRSDIVVSMEMFERDVQSVLYLYLAGDIDENEFLSRSRPWPNYARDYRPIVEFARQNRLEVLAANAPRKLAAQVSKQGIDSVRGSADVARETTAPADDYWRAFEAAMREHIGTGSTEALQRMYAAQCLKDDTMAESIADHWRKTAAEGRSPLFVHICGKFHSDYRRGTVMRLEQRLPDADIRVVSVQVSPDPELGVYATSPRLADYVLLLPEQPKDEAPAAKEAMPQEPRPAAAAAVAQPAGAQPAGAQPEPAPAATGRPALGIRPDYEFAGTGLRIDDVVAGGAAEAAGLQPGDVLVQIEAEPVDDVQGYMVLLSGLTPGHEVEVTIERGGARLQRKVKVGTR